MCERTETRCCVVSWGGLEPGPRRNRSRWLAFAGRARDRDADAIGRRGEAAMQDVTTKRPANRSAPEPARQVKCVGTRPIRPDGVPKVTGRAQSGADLGLPGMLVGRILRSPPARARIRSIDVAKAK